MKNMVKLFALFLMAVFLSSSGQSQINVPKDNIQSETKEVVTSYGPTTSVRTIRQDTKGNM
jgi:hypothetical protein